MHHYRCLLSALALFILAAQSVAADASLAAQKLLHNETFWDNRDWDWYKGLGKK